nr:immunoglobulin light chain junction region [Macaca mulatta]MOW63878.1 immunoglobulin light chain junction region [Macaca mulatta]
CQQYNIAPWTF